MVRIVMLAFLLLSPLKWIYVVDNAKCNGCGNCVYFCPQGAISMQAGNAFIDPELCDGCGTCAPHCPRNAIYRDWYTGIEEDEAAVGVLTFSNNPAAGNSVTVKGASPLSEVRILDGAGREVIRGNTGETGLFVIDTSGLAEGSYFVTADDRSAILTVI